MVSTQGSRRALTCFVLVCYVFAATCTALVVTAPTLDGKAITTTRQPASPKTKIEKLDLKLRIRSTTEADIPQIANMLTQALLEEENLKPNRQQFQPPLNFRFRKIRSGVAPLLQSRMKAIRVGRRVLNDQWAILQNLSEADQLRFLWSNDGFRNSIETAASLSNEPHIWKEHNFVCAPQSFDWLLHKMITAENALTGETIGFCEIAMLSQPADDNQGQSTGVAPPSRFHEECNLVNEQPGIPTIVNLVTSTQYRRRGVGSAVMKSALNYVGKSCSSTWSEMGLYVEEDNETAIRMYERLGFQKERKVESKQQWYMVREIFEEPTMPKANTFEESYDMYLI